MLRVRRAGASDPTLSDGLTFNERIFICIAILFGGIIVVGSIFYFGWKKQMQRDLLAGTQITLEQKQQILDVFEKIQKQGQQKAQHGSLQAIETGATLPAEVSQPSAQKRVTLSGPTTLQTGERREWVITKGDDDAAVEYFFSCGNEADPTTFSEVSFDLVPYIPKIYCRYTNPGTYTLRAYAWNTHTKQLLYIASASVNVKGNSVTDCTEEYVPVCGNIPNLGEATFKNICKLKKANAEYKHDGTCANGQSASVEF